MNMTKSSALAALVTALLTSPGIAAPTTPAPVALTAPASAAAPPILPPQETLMRLGIDPKALATLLKRGADSHSDAIVIIKDDQVVGEWYFGKPQVPIEAMSATKSVVSLAIGCLLHDGKIKSLDEPVCDFYPEWNQGRKKLITIRQLLNHTSGLQADTGVDEVHDRPDAVQLALCAELSSKPGADFLYNNKAVNLLAGIVQKASGQRLDSYLDTRIFAPMGIRNYLWNKDPAGNPFVYAGLEIHALDMAKIGQMLADGGVWQGKQIVDASWIAEMTTLGQLSLAGQALPCGLLWWLEYKSTDNCTVDSDVLQSWRQGGVPAVYITRATPLVGKIFPIPELQAKLNVVFDGHDNKLKYLYYQHVPQFRIVTGSLIAYNANGSLGQYLVVVPKEHLVAVRQISEDNFKNKDTDEFSDFTEIVPTLVRETVEPQPD